MKEETLFKIGYTGIKSGIKGYKNADSIVRNSLPMQIKITNKAIYSSVLWFIPVGKILLKDIISFKIVKKEFVGTTWFGKGVVIKYTENNKINQTIIGVNKREMEVFSENLRKLNIKEEKENE